MITEQDVVDEFGKIVGNMEEVRSDEDYTDNRQVWNSQANRLQITNAAVQLPILLEPEKTSLIPLGCIWLILTYYNLPLIHGLSHSC